MNFSLFNKKPSNNPVPKPLPEPTPVSEEEVKKMKEQIEKEQIEKEKEDKLRK